MNKITTPILLALATAVTSALAITYNKLVVVSGIDSLIFNIIKNGCVAIILTATLLITTQGKQLKGYTTKQWMQLIALGVIGGSIPFILFFEGLKQVPALNANFIHKTLFLWVALLATVILKEKVSAKNLLGYILIVIAAFAISGIPAVSWQGAELMILGATLLWSVEFIYAKHLLKTFDANTLAWARMFFGSIVLILTALSQQKLNLITAVQPSQLIAITGSIALLTVYVVTWYHALKKAPAVMVATVLTLATPIASLLTINTNPRNLIPTLVTMTLITVGIALFTRTQTENKAK